MKNKTIKTLVLATVMLIGLSHVDAVVETDLADKITKNVWSKEQSVELSKEDSITNIAWSQQDAELVAGDYKINAYAADLEEKSVESIDKADVVTKNIWSKEQSVELSKEDSITNIAWSQQDAELVAGDYKINAYAADLEEASVESVDKADGVTKNIWAETIKKTDVKEDLISRKAWL